MDAGDIVVAPFPLTNQRGYKYRPVVLLRYVDMDDWIACEITTQRQAARMNQIGLAPADLVTGVLDKPSVVRYDRLQTINEQSFGDYIGRLTDQKLAEITSAVRALF